MTRSLLACVMLCLLFGTGCVSTIKFESVPKAQVTLHTWKDIEGAGKPLGDTPLEIDANKLDGNIVKMAAPGRRPQFFAFPGSAQGELRLKVNLAESPLEGLPEKRATDSVVTLESVNKLNRRMLAVFQALLDQDYKSAKQMAHGISENNPQLAAPFILQGLAELYDGDRDGARVAFKSAQSLDPEDHALTEMLKVLQ